MAIAHDRNDATNVVRDPGENFDFAHWTELPHFDATQASTPRCDTVGWFERAVAAMIVLAISPLILVIALAIKLESPHGPAFFRQTRVGVDRRRKGGGDVDGGEWTGERDRRKTPGDGQVFRIWKFRTMIPDAEARTGPVWASQNDPRITRMGNLLRPARLDELPQFFNVAAGHMHLIGPRPERPELIAGLVQDVPDYTARLSIRPGITGLAQVEREYDESVDHVRRKVMYDTFYIENKCWLLDLKILAKTIGVVLRGWGSR